MTYLDGGVGDCTVAITVPTAVAVGDLVVVVAVNFTGNANVLVDTNARVTTWTKIDIALSQDGDMSSIWWGYVTSAGSLIVRAGDGSPGANVAGVWRSSTGSYTQDAAIVATHVNAGTSPPITGGSTTATTQAIELIIGAVASTLATATFAYTAGTGFTMRSQTYNGGSSAAGLEDTTTSSTGVQAASFGYSQNLESGIWTMSFYETGGGGGGSTILDDDLGYFVSKLPTQERIISVW